MRSYEPAKRLLGIADYRTGRMIDMGSAFFSARLPLRPTDLLIFGNAKGGTPLMQSVQTIGIDLPLKALVWQDADGKVWLSYNAPDWIAARAGLGEKSAGAVAAMTKALAAIAEEATT